MIKPLIAQSIRRGRDAQTGFSLVELMVAVTIGLLLLTGLTVIFINSSSANRELQKASQQTENGRYAIDLLTQDIRHAGFYGHFSELANATALPDPCDTSSTSVLSGALSLPLQGIRAADLSTVASVSGTSCGTLLPLSNLKAGSDILVIRRAATTVLAVGSTALANEAYLQANNSSAEVQLGNGLALAAGKKANGADATLFLKNGTTAAPIRKLVTHIYFVAPCSVGSGTGGVCQSGDDAIPTLKRLELGAGSSGAALSLKPLVEGIDYLKLEYGIDNVPSTVNTATGATGDGNVDSFVTAPTLAEWGAVVGAKVFILARNTEATFGYQDIKTYKLGSGTASGAATTTSVTTAAANDAFKRHLFTSVVQLVNPRGRKEIP
jgi:type IV pilus assembly protein PilW